MCVGEGGLVAAELPGGAIRGAVARAGPPVDLRGLHVRPLQPLDALVVIQRQHFNLEVQYVGQPCIRVHLSTYEAYMCDPCSR
jgi:hypothetical protein